MNIKYEISPNIQIVLPCTNFTVPKSQNLIQHYSTSFNDI